MPPGEHFNAVVIGSGFGGSVVAKRLADAGRSVLVLERGQPHAPGSFARTPFGMRTGFWAPDDRLFGMFDVWSFDHLDVVLASGLGGGSLIYANVMLRKPERTFVREDPDEGYEFWPVERADLEPHYNNVEGYFDRPERYPYATDTPKTREMLAAGKRIGLVGERPMLAVRFAADRVNAAPGRPLPDGGDNLHRVARSTCRLCGECDVGCNYGSKSTLDLTCLSDVWRRPNADIRTCCEVTTITPVDGLGGDGNYEVAYTQHIEARGSHPADLLDHDQQRLSAKVRADDVVLAAGAIGTPRLLLENRASLRALSPALGSRVSANGDYFAWIRNCRNPDDGEPRYLEPSLGPVITTSLHVDEDRSPSGRGYYLQDAGAPAFADWPWQALEVPRDLYRARKLIKKQLCDRLRGRRDAHKSGLLAALFGNAQSSAAMMPILAMGRDIPNGRLRLADGGLQLDWSAEPSSEYYEGVTRSLEQLAQELGGKLVQTGLARRRRAITVHPVGGCAMATNPRLGVVEPSGQVFGHPRLWIADGSVMPGPVGPNPSFTIAALADRFADAMLGVAP